MQFVKNGEEVKVFPERLVIGVVAVVTHIPTKRTGPVVSKPSDEFMRSLKFEAHWKTGLQMRLAKELTLERVSTPYSGYHSTSWSYTLTLKDVDVPLTDHLILDVLSPEGKRVVRLSASL